MGTFKSFAHILVNDYITELERATNPPP